MQHLRTVGVQEDGVDSVLIEAPTKSRSKGKGKHSITLIEIPPEALPSTSEIPRNFESQEAIPSSISGFQPDMDPHLRQVLEALEDDAFVEDELEDDFFSQLVADGERGSDEEVDYEFREAGIEHVDEHPQTLDGDSSWQQRFADFKKNQAGTKQTSDDGYDSEGGDTVGTLPAISVIGGKKKRKAASDASGYSMSSSSMVRNEALRTLDDRFDQVSFHFLNLFFATADKSPDR